MHFKLSSANCQPSCLGLNELTSIITYVTLEWVIISPINEFLPVLCQSILCQSIHLNPCWHLKTNSSEIGINYDKKLICKCMQSINDFVQAVGPKINVLTHWGRLMHICVGKPTIIGSNNGLSLDRRQAIIWTNAGILLIAPLRTNFSEILTRIQTFSFKKMHLKMASAKWRPFCFGLNVLNEAFHFICKTRKSTSIGKQLTALRGNKNQSHIVQWGLE